MEDHLNLLKKLTWDDMFLVAGIIVLAWLIVAIAHWAIRYSAEKFPARFRLVTLRLLPISSLMIAIAAIVTIVPVLIDPQDVPDVHHESRRNHSRVLIEVRGLVRELHTRLGDYLDPHL